jgi:hypothetical protein
MRQTTHLPLEALFLQNNSGAVGYFPQIVDNSFLPTAVEHAPRFFGVPWHIIHTDLDIGIKQKWALHCLHLRAAEEKQRRGKKQAAPPATSCSLLHINI